MSNACLFEIISNGHLCSSWVGSGIAQRREGLWASLSAIGKRAIPVFVQGTLGFMIRDHINRHIIVDILQLLDWEVLEPLYKDRPPYQSWEHTYIYIYTYLQTYIDHIVYSKALQNSPSSCWHLHFWGDLAHGADLLVPSPAKGVPVGDNGHHIFIQISSNIHQMPNVYDLLNEKNISGHHFRIFKHSKHNWDKTILMNFNPWLLCLKTIHPNSWPIVGGFWGTSFWDIPMLVQDIAAIRTQSVHRYQLWIPESQLTCSHANPIFHLGNLRFVWTLKYALKCSRTFPIHSMVMTHYYDWHVCSY